MRYMAISVKLVDTWPPAVQHISYPQARPSNLLARPSTCSHQSRDHPIGYHTGTTAIHILRCQMYDHCLHLIQPLTEFGDRLFVSSQSSLTYINLTSIPWRSCISVEDLSSILSERINSRTIEVRSESPSGLRRVLLLNRPGVGDISHDWSSRGWEAVILSADIWPRELGVGNDTVWLFNLSVKCWPGVERVDLFAAFLVCSEGCCEYVNGSSIAVVSWTEPLLISRLTFRTCPLRLSDSKETLQ